MKDRILIAGGAKDPNLLALYHAARARNISVLPLFVEAGHRQAIHWGLGSGELQVNDSIVSPQACFLRRDVFHAGKELAEHSSRAWYALITGWLSAHPEIRWLNRQYAFRFTNKIDMLRRAALHGLKIPVTLITNKLDFEQHELHQFVAKPVAGGGYCMNLTESLAGSNRVENLGASPAIVQSKISGSDVRIYRVGDGFFGFRIRSEEVDYRRTVNREIENMERLDPAIVRKLKTLMDSLGMDWGAADFKQCDDCGKLYFLEVNSNPMFSAFDKVAEGILTNAILGFLH